MSDRHALPSSIDATQALLDGENDVADPALATVLVLALKMGRPLFLDGEAGAGKTGIAEVLAAALDRPLIRLPCYEGLDVSSAPHEGNYAAQMIEIRLREASGDTSREALRSERFLIPRPILQALDGAPGRAPVLLIERMIAMVAPPRHGMPETKRAGPSRVSDALSEGARPRGTRPEIGIDASLAVSGTEVLRAKDFAQMSLAGTEGAQRAISALRLPADRVRTRRFRPDPRGERIDPRRTMQASMRGGGELILPKFRSRREVHPPLVGIADISGSMSRYTRIVLYFLHAPTARRRRVHTFLFGTRLTDVTRQMRHRDPDDALADCAGAAKDWSGGTRIAEALHAFNRDRSRRVPTQEAVAILITDGLERGSVATLEAETKRLHKSCRRLIRLNPLLRCDGFPARAHEARAMLPHVDAFRPIHSLAAMGELCAALSGRGGAAADPRRRTAAADAAVAA